MVTSYLRTADKSTCYGCRACELACPKNAISILPDEEGFIYPVLSQEKCIDCSVCYNTCPYDNPSMRVESKAGYALQYKDEVKLMNSSSGAAFPAFADYILKHGGYVSGCIFNDTIEAVHVVTNEAEVVDKMSGSKYVQSDVKDSYLLVKKLLQQGNTVLYSGTPCQIAGLLKYLKKPHENLYTIDLICHGVPSPALLREYLTATYSGVVSELKFRDKKKNGWCSQGTITWVSSSGRVANKRISPYTDSYYYYYLQNSISRYCCYKCEFSAKERVSDITIGDYWNACEAEPDFDTGKGVSAILINSDKGLKLLESVRSNIIIKTTHIADIIKGNGNLQKPCDKPRQRDYIYEKIRKEGYVKVTAQECDFSYIIPFIKKLIPVSCKRLIKRIISKFRINDEN